MKDVLMGRGVIKKGKKKKKKKKMKRAKSPIEKMVRS
jgi:hypothetical protein